MRKRNSAQNQIVGQLKISSAVSDVVAVKSKHDDNRKKFQWYYKNVDATSDTTEPLVTTSYKNTEKELVTYTKTAAENYISFLNDFEEVYFYGLWDYWMDCLSFSID